MMVAEVRGDCVTAGQALNMSVYVSTCSVKKGYEIPFTSFYLEHSQK